MRAYSTTLIDTRCVHTGLTLNLVGEKKTGGATFTVFAPLSLWPALSTISLASHCSVASLELSIGMAKSWSTLCLAFRHLSVFNFGWHSQL